jgi:hypothetical protein
MAHYRKIEIDGRTFEYVVGNHRVKINELKSNGITFTAVEVGLFNVMDIGHVIDEDKVEVRPSHIEKTIRRHLAIPQRPYAWDTPITKKSDPGPRSRGFRALIGVCIVDIRVSAINEVILKDMDGTCYAIESEAGPYGLPVIKLRVLAGNEAED